MGFASCTLWWFATSLKMQRKRRASLDFEAPEPCPFLRRFATYIVGSNLDAPILDVACGAGRNAVFLAQSGRQVICIDKDLTELRMRCSSDPPRDNCCDNLQLCEMDLVHDPWPFGAGTAGAIISVHFLLPALFPRFESSLLPGGYLLIETVPAHGGNYLELPRAGELRFAFQRAFDFEYYRERKAGPGNYDAVTVQLFAKRRQLSDKPGL
ncbi:MAG: class I SAM-dependent methyltransferase [Candidatus Acidiferrales bacterium]